MERVWKKKKEGERLFVQFESCLNVFHYLWMIHRCYEAGCEKRLLCYVHRTLSNRSFYRPSLVPFTRILEFKQLHYVYCLSLLIKHISDTTSAPKSVVHNNYDSQTWQKMKLTCWIYHLHYPCFKYPIKCRRGYLRHLQNVLYSNILKVLI